MSDPNIKNIQLTGGVTMEMGDTRRKGRKQSKAKTFKIDRSEGGGSTSPGTLTQLSASRVPGSAGAPEPVGVDSALTAKGSPVQVAGKAKATEAKAAEAKAAEQPMKVVLAAAKKKGRVVLAPAKPAAPASTGKTRKVSHTKKVRVTISNLSKKIHKAKEIRRVATETTLDEVKKVLSKAGLIKTDSKAPDTMLRQMYADYMTLKGRAL